MTDADFAHFMDLGHELRAVEFKSPGSLLDNRLTAQVVKAVLGLANRRDGGNVMIGVAEEGNSCARLAWMTLP